MFNYLIKIEYVGTNFVGWQSQKNGKSIQDSVEKALTRVLKSQIRVIGSGRTDKGVHALSQYANFKSKIKIYEKKIFLNSVNFFLSYELGFASIVISISFLNPNISLDKSIIDSIISNGINEGVPPPKKSVFRYLKLILFSNNSSFIANN